MATLTEMVAAVVVHSSAAAFSHFGVTFDLPKVEQRNVAAERVVARTPRQAAARPARVEPAGLQKAGICPDKTPLVRA
ncbi:MAG: hypothetical protein JNK30_06200 [Phenylobacterium sp.]|uniref:hypothetical protein n=1 Tax=Phenylobacterium sp. TaxID=1871053 RepID=UPI001A466D06|nr:hypothetical protein [Phenylobacterium sp.]MBL8770957.1 hypothetical protein [Phenylobacterium sp.]